MKNKKYYIIIAVGGILTILVGLLLYKFVFIKTPPPENPQVQDSKKLSEEEKQKIFEELGKVNAKPLSAQEKTKIFNQLKTSTSKPLSNEEKDEIFKSL